MQERNFESVYANALFLRGYHREAFDEYFKGAVDERDPMAAFNLAFMYHQGISVPRNYMMAHRFFLAASGLDGGEAQFNLALMYLRGQGVETDAKRAAEYMKTSAARQCVNAQLYLGAAYTMGYMFDPVDIECISLIPFYRVIERRRSELYLSGAGGDTRLEDQRYEVLEADEQYAVEMLEAAAGHKDTTYIDKQVGIAKQALGQAYIEGFGIDYDPKKGYKLLEEAAIRHGSAEAAMYLLKNGDTAKVYGIDTAKMMYLTDRN
ncbi:MAG: sel1 repeat family protein [Clostridia bacterium]|nr:sel1 repeat family protein [Clostridia bacterium]